MTIKNQFDKDYKLGAILPDGKLISDLQTKNDKFKEFSFDIKAGGETEIVCIPGLYWGVWADDKMIATVSAKDSCMLEITDTGEIKQLACEEKADPSNKNLKEESKQQ